MTVTRLTAEGAEGAEKIDRGKAYHRGAEGAEEIKTAPLESLFVITVQKRF